MSAVSVIAAIAAMCALAVALWQAKEAKQAQDAAKLAQDAAKQAQDEAAAARKAVEQATGSALQARTAAEEARNGAEGARSAARDAQESAGASRMLADEAQRTAAEAVEQVETFREQLAIERHRRGMPTFEIAPAGVDQFYLSYRGGPAVIDNVTVSVVPGSRVLGLSLGGEPPAEQLEIGPIAYGTSVSFRAATGQRASAVFSVLAEPWEPVVVRADL